MADIKEYFGDNFNTNPSQLTSLNQTQKSNLFKIINDSKDSGISSHFAIAGILSVLSQRNNFTQIDSNLINSFFEKFDSILDEVSTKLNIIKKSNGKATINGINTLEKSADSFYLSEIGWNNLNKLLNYKIGAFSREAELVFPNDNIGDYTKIRNRIEYFYKIILKGEESPNNNQEEPTPDSNEPTQESENTNLIEQEESDDPSNSEESDKEYEFNPVQLNRILKPNVTLTEIELQRGGATKQQKEQFLTGVGTAPFVYYNGVHIEYRDIDSFSLYHEGILPAIKMIFKDRNGILRDNGFPLDDTIISIFIYSGSKLLRSIQMDFKVTNFKDLGGVYSLQGIVNIPKIYLRKFSSYSKKTSFEALKQVAKECQIGFSSNISDTNDKMTWINPAKPIHEFILDVVDNSYKSDESYMFCYIDFYYNLCYVDLEKEYNRDNTEDKQIITDGKRQFTENDEKENISKLLFTTDRSFKESNSWIKSFKVNNRSTKISINNAFLTKTKYYDSINKELLIFDIDSITSRSNDKMILKGKPDDSEYFKENIDNIWSGKLDKFDDGAGNAHENFNYSPIQNKVNLNEMSKISLSIEIPNPNFNVYITQKVFVALLKEVPGVAQKGGLNFKRLDGNWIINQIEHIFDGNKYFQKIELIKRELELFDDEKNSEPNNNYDSKINDDDSDHENELSPFDEEPNDPTTVDPLEDNPISNITEEEFTDTRWKEFDIEKAISQIQSTEFKARKIFVESLRKVLIYIKGDNRVTDLREAAYILGTGFGEANYSLQRWEGDYLYKGTGIPYESKFHIPEHILEYYRSTINGKKNYYTLGLDKDGFPYFGRGLIQLTGKYNYEKYGKKLGINLIDDGDKALLERNSYDIAVEYLRDNTFKFVKENNLILARRSVNGGIRNMEIINKSYNTWVKILSPDNSIS